MILSVAFLLASVVALTAGILVALERNVVVSALDLAVCLLSVGGIYLMMDAYMLAAIQVFVYAGAVVVLFLFVIMLLSLHEDARRAVKLRVQIYAAPVLGALMCALLARRTLESGPYGELPPLSPEAAAARSASVGRAMLVSYLYPFEVVSILLLVAVVAALVTARRRAVGEGGEKTA